MTRKFVFHSNREYNEIIKKLILAEITSGLETFDPYELREFITSVDPDVIDTLLETHLESNPELFCEALLKVSRILRTRVEVRMIDVCLKLEGKQIQAG